MCKGTGAKNSLKCLKNSKLSDTVGAEGYGCVGGQWGWYSVDRELMNK